MNLEVIGDDFIAALKTRLHAALHDAAMLEAAYVKAQREIAQLRAELEEKTTP